MKTFLILAATFALAGSEFHTAEFPSGKAIAVSKERAEELAKIGREAVTLFEQKFGPVKGQGMICTIDAQKNEHVKETLAAKGYAWKLPWFEDASNVMKQAIEDQVRKQLQGKSEEVIQATIEKALAAQPKGAASRKGLDVALSHEVGHMLFISKYWPDRHPETEHKKEAGSHYGGPASDWLDEAAAIALEGESLTQNRRKQFAKAVHGPDKGMIWGLAELLTMKHPAMGTNLVDNTKPDGSLTFKRLDSNDPAVKRQSLFYAQIRNFIDFLESRTKNPKVLGEIAETEVAGKSFADWLKTNAARYGLPSDLSALEGDWKAAWPAPSTESATNG